MIGAIVTAWAVESLACGIIAHLKGRSVAGWAVLGLFGGVIAMIVLACLPKVPDWRMDRGKAMRPLSYGQPKQDEAARVLAELKHDAEGQ